MAKTHNLRKKTAVESSIDDSKTNISKYISISTNMVRSQNLFLFSRRFPLTQTTNISK